MAGPGTGPTQRRYTMEEVREALSLNGGLIAPAARALGCARSTVRDYIERYPELVDHLAEVKETTLDMAEGILMEAIGKRNLTAVIFYLKCQGKARGYVERQEIHGQVLADVRAIGIEKVGDLTDEQLEDLRNGRTPSAEGSG